MFNPAHPGIILNEDYLEPLQISQTEFAKILHVSRQTIAKIVNGKAGISPEMAIRLSMALNTTPDLWLNMQQQYDLFNAAQKFDAKIDPVFDNELASC